jgi:hypothetical protein
MQPKIRGGSCPGSAKSARSLQPSPGRYLLLVNCAARLFRNVMATIWRTLALLAESQRLE